MIYIFPILMACSVPHETEAGSNMDFEKHSAIYVCSDSDSHSIRHGEPVYIKGKQGQGKERIYSVSTQLSSNEITEVMIWGSWNSFHETAYIPSECIIEFSRFKRMNSIAPDYFAFDITTAEKIVRKGASNTRTNFTYESPAEYVRFMSDGRIEFGSFAERVVDKSDMPNHYKDYGLVFGYGDFYYARLEYEGGPMYLVGAKKGKKILTVFDADPFAPSDSNPKKSAP